MKTWKSCHRTSWAVVQNAESMADWILLDKTRTGIQRVIQQILDHTENSEERNYMVSRILDVLNSLSSRLILVELLRRLDTPGSGVVPEWDLEEYENMLRNDIIAASSENLADECDLLRVLYYAKGYAADNAYHTDMSVSELTITVLLSSLWKKAVPYFWPVSRLKFIPNWSGTALSNCMATPSIYSKGSLNSKYRSTTWHLL